MNSVRCHKPPQGLKYTKWTFSMEKVSRINSATTFLYMKTFARQCRKTFIGLSVQKMVGRDRRSQDFVWECTFSSKKLTTFFSRRPQKTV